MGLTERAGDQAEGDKGCSPTASMLKDNPPQQDAVAPHTLFSSHAIGKKKNLDFALSILATFEDIVQYTGEEGGGENLHLLKQSI